MTIEKYMSGDFISLGVVVLPRNSKKAKISKRKLHAYHGIRIDHLSHDTTLSRNIRQRLRF